MSRREPIGERPGIKPPPPPAPPDPLMGVVPAGQMGGLQHFIRHARQLAEELDRSIMEAPSPAAEQTRDLAVRDLQGLIGLLMDGKVSHACALAISLERAWERR